MHFDIEHFTTPARKKNMDRRDAWIDNSRAILIIFVVIGHFLVVLTGFSEEMYWLRKYIYLFHMPAFLFLCGLLSKRRIEGRRYAVAIKHYLVPYLICNFIMFIIFQLIGVDSSHIDAQASGLSYEPFNPYYSFWFFLALFLYSMITPPCSASAPRVLNRTEIEAFLFLHLPSSPQLP